MSKGGLCHLAKYGGQFKEEAKQILRSKGLSCDYRQQRLAEAQGARQAARSPGNISYFDFSHYDDVSLCSAIVSANDNYLDDRLAELNVRGGLKICSITMKNLIMEKFANRGREIEKRQIANAKRQAEAKRKIEKRRRAEAQRKAEERRKAEHRRQAEAKREAEESRRAEAKRKTDAAKKAKLYRVGSGSGFSISRDGLIVTNHHVIDGCSAVAISDKGELYRAAVQSIDERNDLALLKSKLRPRHVFALNPNGTDILREIYVAGYPFGRDVSDSVKVTKGIVSSMVGLENNSSQIQIDAPIQTGNSGGPAQRH